MPFLSLEKILMRLHYRLWNSAQICMQELEGHKGGVCRKKATLSRDIRNLEDTFYEAFPLELPSQQTSSGSACAVS